MITVNDCVEEAADPDRRFTDCGIHWLVVEAAAVLRHLRKEIIHRVLVVKGAVFRISPGVQQGNVGHPIQTWHLGV
jgi:hypothetical protein